MNLRGARPNEPRIRVMHFRMYSPGAYLNAAAGTPRRASPRSSRRCPWTRTGLSWSRGGDGPRAREARAEMIESTRAVCVLGFVSLGGGREEGGCAWAQRRCNAHRHRCCAECRACSACVREFAFLRAVSIYKPRCAHISIAMDPLFVFCFSVWRSAHNKKATTQKCHASHNLSRSHLKERPNKRATTRGSAPYRRHPLPRTRTARNTKYT